MDEGITNGRSAAPVNVDRAGGKREPVLVTVELDAPVEGGNFSTLVIVRLAGTLPDALCLRRFEEGLCKSVGEVCLERFRDVKLPGVLTDPFCDIPIELGVKG
jgi:hypothetical protein